MELSKHNILVRLENTDKYVVVNLLAQSADIIDEQQYLAIKNGTYHNSRELIEKGYLVDPADESKLYQGKYLEFIDNRETDEVQLFFVPNYACNFSCSYCYQDEYSVKSSLPGTELIDAFFSYVEQNFKHRKKYITLFGGEPLLNSNAQIQLIEKFVHEANKRRLDLAIVTNGYHLNSYLPLLKTASIREIQVTLDGVGNAHDKRRPLRSGEGTFERIVEGIDNTLKEGIAVNLRMVVDKENISELPELADFSIKKGWTKNPLFKTQLGRNYELHHCQKNSKQLYSRLELYRDIYYLLKKHPGILEFHRPAFSVSKFLFEEGILPEPLFDSCPGAKTEWAFDFTGRIYSCTATVGKEGEELGSFYPEVSLDEEKIKEWEERDVFSIKQCRDCSLQLACGGGCAAVAKNQHGKICSPDCRPVDALMGLGISYYFETQKKAAI
jgi:uncharacterized protein